MCAPEVHLGRAVPPRSPSSTSSRCTTAGEHAVIPQRVVLRGHNRRRPSRSDCSHARSSSAGPGEATQCGSQEKGRWGCHQSLDPAAPCDGRGPDPKSLEAYFPRSHLLCLNQNLYMDVQSGHPQPHSGDTGQSQAHLSAPISSSLQEALPKSKAGISSFFPFFQPTEKFPAHPPLPGVSILLELQPWGEELCCQPGCNLPLLRRVCSASRAASPH